MNKLNSSKKPLVWFSALLLTAAVAGCGGQDPILGGGAGANAGGPGPVGGGVSNLPAINTAMLGLAAPFGMATTAGLTNTTTTPITHY